MQSEKIESILKKAVSRENSSYQLYKKAANNAKDVNTKSFLNKLAERELKHKQAIEDFNIEILKRQEIEINETFLQDIEGYFIMDEGIREDSDFNDVLDYAVKREKKSFVFYSTLSKLIDDPDLQKLLVWLAQEELKHKEDLFREQSVIKGL